MVHLTSLPYGLVAKAEIDTETTQSLQQVIIVFDKCNHLIFGLIHLQILHTAIYLIIYIDGAKVLNLRDSCNSYKQIHHF